MNWPQHRSWPLGFVAMAALGAILLWKHPPGKESLSAQATLGKLIFHDTGLSASGQQSCATCHIASLGHASSKGIEPGGENMQQPGLRNVPSLRYLKFNQAFQRDGEGKVSGGFFWDGRADSLQSQAGEPFLNPDEMANRSKAEVVLKLQQSAYASRFVTLFGKAIWDDSEKAFAAMTQALASYQQEDPVFASFNSKFDRVMRGEDKFTPEQERGWRLFTGEDKANCAACHPAQSDNPKVAALFTDFSYDNLGVPRNPLIAANRDAKFHDLGLCAAKLENAQNKPTTGECGAFKVPSLRNIAVRRVFFHNARFSDLREVIAFYASRDTDPSRWYGSSSQRFNDVPGRYQNNVNSSEIPYNQSAGEAARLSEQDIDDLLAFLHTLSDADLTAAKPPPAVSKGLPKSTVYAGR